MKSEFELTVGNAVHEARLVDRQREIERLRGVEVAAEEKIISLSSEVAVLKSELERVMKAGQAVLEREAKRLKESAAEIAGLKALMLKSEGELREKSSEIAGLSSDLAIAHEDLDTVKKEVVRVKLDFEAAKKAIAELEKDRNVIGEELSKMTISRDALTVENMKHSGELIVMRQEIAALKKAQSALKCKLTKERKCRNGNSRDVK